MKPGVREWLALWRVKGSPRELPLWMLLTVPAEAFEGIIDESFFRFSMEGGRALVSAHWPHKDYTMLTLRTVDKASFSARVADGPDYTAVAIVKVGSDPDVYTTWWECAPIRDEALLEPYTTLERARESMRDWIRKRDAWDEAFRLSDSMGFERGMSVVGGYDCYSGLTVWQERWGA